MIDTDKYKGHTPAPWLNHNPDDEMADRHDHHDYMVGAYEKDKDGNEHFNLIADWAGCVNCLPDAHSIIAEKPDWANARLIADAPLLLAEVNKLREQHTELREALVGDSPNWTHEELIEKVLEIYDKALVFDIIYDFNERMQLQSESYENELWRMDWLLKNPTKEYEDYDKEMIE